MELHLNICIIITGILRKMGSLIMTFPMSHQIVIVFRSQDSRMISQPISNVLSYANIL